MQPSTSHTPGEGDDRAVTPVVGIVLLVAITIVLAAVIGTFVLGIGEEVEETAPTADFSFEYDDDDPNVTITHEGGQEIPGDELHIVGPQGEVAWEDGHDAEPGPVVAGSSTEIGDDHDRIADEGETIRVVWRGDELSATLAESEARNDVGNG